MDIRASARKTEPRGTFCGAQIRTDGAVRSGTAAKDPPGPIIGPGGFNFQMSGNGDYASSASYSGADPSSVPDSLNLSTSSRRVSASADNSWLVAELS